MSIVTRKLVAKELHVNRWFLVGASLAAVLSASAATFGKTAFNIGALAWITTVIALGVMLAIYGVMHERKERSLEFVLSLPLSVGEYVRAKLLGLLLSFLLPWLVSTLAVIVLVLADADVPDGLLPYTLLLCMFLLTNFSLVLCGTLHANSEAMTSAVIIVTNMLVSVFMFTVGVLPGLRNSMFGAVPVWNETFWTVLIAELLVFVIALTLPLFIAARRRDFI
jgi:ABC-type transport system involved in multi-copper enzyme maturation permease subunit